MTQDDRLYAVRLSREARKGLDRLTPRRRESAHRFMEVHLKTHPLQRVTGKVKQLKGRYTGFLQFDIDSSYRLIYSVDRDSRVVYVDYIGPHPKW